MSEESVSGAAEDRAQVVAEEPKAEGLPLRDAIEVSLIAHEAPDKQEPAPIAKVEPAKVEPEVKPLDPPAEYTGAAKTAFQKAPREVQEDIIRLHRSQSDRLGEIKRESAELQWAKDIVKEITPFLKTRGDKEPTHAQIIKALKVVNEIDGAPKKAVAEILKAKGLEVPKELLEEEKTATDISAQLSPLQARLNALESERAQEIATRTQEIGNRMWQSFEASKNAAGKPKYADIQGNSESALRLSRSIGTLVWDDSPLARQFIASVKNRIPNATAEQLLHEAYVFSGGKVDDSEAPKSHSANNHIARSNRAASSVPGKGTNGFSNGVAKKMTLREALADAVERHKEE